MECVAREMTHFQLHLACADPPPTDTKLLVAPTKHAGYMVKHAWGIKQVSTIA